MKLDKILVAVDGSETSMRAMEYAVDLGNLKNSESRDPPP